MPINSVKPSQNLTDSNPYGFRESFNDQDINKFGPGIFIPPKIE
jgi:hypothetical protein